MMKFRPFGHNVQPVAAMARQFCAARVTDPSRQPSVSGQPAVLPRKMPEATAGPLVPEVTSEQKEASAAVKTAKREAAAASTYAEKVATETAVLKRLYEEFAAKQVDAQQDAKARQQAVLAAKAAKKSADEKAIKMIESKRKQDKRFLENAFYHFDTDKKGLITPSQLQAILADCKLPSNGEDVDLLDGIRDRQGWLLHMPADLKASLEKHPQAGGWVL